MTQKSPKNHLIITWNHPKCPQNDPEFESILKIFSKYFQNIVQILSQYYQNNFEIFSRYHQKSLKIFSKYFQNILLLQNDPKMTLNLKIFWKYSRSIFQILSKYYPIVIKIFANYFQDILKIVEKILKIFSKYFIAPKWAQNDPEFENVLKIFSK